MSEDEVDDIITRQFRAVGRRNLSQLLEDVRERLRRPSGWAPTKQNIIWRAERLGFCVRSYWMG